jgi:hypothetical protein
VTNVGFSAVKSVSVLLSIRFADTLLVAHVLGLVLLFRRTGTLGGNLTQFGLSQALQKFYLAIADRPARAKLWESLARWAVLAAVVTILVSVMLAKPMSDFFFGQQDRILSLALGIYVASIALSFTAGTSWAVEFNLFQYNLIDWLNGSLLFILCLLLAHSLPANYFLLLLALTGLLASVISLAFFRRKFVVPHLEGGVPWSIPPDIRSYGLSRAVTAFSDLGTTVLGPWLLSERPDEAGYLIIAYMVIRVAQSLVLPVALVFALRANDAMMASDVEMRRIRMLGIMSVAAGVVCVFFYYPLAPYVMPLIAPNSHLPVTIIVDKLIPFLPAVFGFYALRNYIDIRYHFPFNLCTLVASMLALLAVVWLRGTVSLDTVIEGSMAMFGIFYIYIAAVGVALFRTR